MEPMFHGDAMRWTMQIFVCYKAFTSINTQFVVDHRGIVRSVCCGAAGGVTDATVFINSSIYKKMREGTWPVANAVDVYVVSQSSLTLLLMAFTPSNRTLSSHGGVQSAHCQSSKMISTTSSRQPASLLNMQMG